jgi:hypothetical protein
METGLKMLAALLLGLTLPAAITIERPAPPAQPPIRLASICVKTGEKLNGANKDCFYNCGGEGRVLTVPSRTICPLTITY